jgi:hypothetical protein
MQANVEAGNLEGASATIRFDKEQAQDFNLGHSTDGDALFFEDAKGIISQMLAHQSMLFRFTPFNSGPQETSFNVRGLGTVIKPLQKACDWDPEKEAQEEAKKTTAAAALELQVIQERMTRLLDKTLPEHRRLMAANDLGLMATPNIKLAVPALVQALADPSNAMKMAAAEALGNIGPVASEAVPVLEALDNPKTDFYVVMHARAALQKIKP